MAKRKEAGSYLSKTNERAKTSREKREILQLIKTPLVKRITTAGWVLLGFIVLNLAALIHSLLNL